MTKKMTEAERRKLLINALKKAGYDETAIAEIVRLAFVDKLPAPPPVPEEQ